MKPKPPFVYIAGAGPGDAGLLTIKTHQLITQIADVVIYDRLITDEILNLIPPNIEKIYAGKSCRNHHMTQDEINSLLVEKSREGKVVVRLKGGDPFIYGRGGEEAIHLVNNHIPFEIVPGVNAADGCAAYQGIPLTHRGVASGVRFITGHQQKGEKTLFDWNNLVDENTTLVVYMGLAHLEELAKNLIQHGLPENTPAVAISNGTTTEEKVCFAPLSDLYEKASKANLKAPTISIIGKVVALADQIKPEFISRS